MSDIVVRYATAADEAQWRRLWGEYNSFYQAPKITEEVTAETWRRILDKENAIACLIAEQNGAVQGFIHYVIHPRTWSMRDTCYMEDLYVAPHVRRKGVARHLCAALKELCIKKNLSRIYWNTQEGNETARRFYDKIASKDDFIRYVMLIP